MSLIDDAHELKALLAADWDSSHGEILFSVCETVAEVINNNDSLEEDISSFWELWGDTAPIPPRELVRNAFDAAIRFHAPTAEDDLADEIYDNARA